MQYSLPEGVSSVEQLNFSSAVPILKKSLMSGFPIPVKGSSPVLGFKAKKWGQGMMGDKNALWRRGRGLAHGKVSSKFKAKVNN